jgi:hypothetical protein
MIVTNVGTSATQLARAGRAWFRAFRRTRPFWGVTWLFLGGFWILHFSMSGLQIALANGFNGVSGWVIGGGMMLCATIGLIAPSQRYTVGIIGLVLSIVSLVASNLGGFFLGISLGILGTTMMLAWGPKRLPRRLRKAAAATD